MRIGVGRAPIKEGALTLKTCWALPACARWRCSREAVVHLRASRSGADSEPPCRRSAWNLTGEFPPRAFPPRVCKRTVREEGKGRWKGSPAFFPSFYRAVWCARGSYNVTRLFRDETTKGTPTARKLKTVHLHTRFPLFLFVSLPRELAVPRWPLSRNRNISRILRCRKKSL